MSSSSLTSGLLLPTSSKALNRLARQLISSSLAPQEKALRDQGGYISRQGAALGTRAAGYYGGLASYGNVLTAGRQAAADQLKTRLAGVSSDAQGQIDRARGLAGQGLAADQAVRGGGLGGGAEGALASQMANQSAAAARDAQNYQSSSAQSSDAYKALLNNMLASSASRGGEVQGQIARDTQSSLDKNVNQPIANLESQKPGLVADEIQKLGQDQFNNAVTLKGLGIKQSDLELAQTKEAHQNQVAQGTLSLSGKRLAESIRHNQAGEVLAGRRIRVQADGQELNHRDRLLKILNSKGAGGLSPSQLASLHKSNQKVRSDIRTYAALIPKMLKATDKKSNKPLYKSASDVRAALYQAAQKLSGDSQFSHDIVNAAFDLHTNHGSLSLANYTALHSQHIGIPFAWRPPEVQSAPLATYPH